jgi:hypothetical protein
VACCILLAGCQTAALRSDSQPAAIAKVMFPLDDIRADGLRGPPDGLRSVAYEFCIPGEEQAYRQVREIDPSLQIHSGAPGRIGCSKQQSLCIGETHQPDWHQVLQRLAALSYVSEIQQSFFE